MGLPWRYALRCIDELELILRAEVVWDKPNGMPESVTDRVRRSHEQWFHFTKEERYFSAVDEIREPHAPQSLARAGRNRFAPDLSQQGVGGPNTLNPEQACNPLGKLPGSVWEVSTEPLRVPEELGIDHFAAFPTEWPRRIILGWSPSGICVECNEGRRPVAEKLADGRQRTDGNKRGTNGLPGYKDVNRSEWSENVSRVITGYECACEDATAETRPAVVLDPFGGTGTTAMVAKALGRTGISVDLSADYCRLAEWRTTDAQQIRKVQSRTYGVSKEAPKISENQQSLFDVAG
jgi:DNA modification methylase